MTLVTSATTLRARLQGKADAAALAGASAFRGAEDEEEGFAFGEGRHDSHLAGALAQQYAGLNHLAADDVTVRVEPPSVTVVAAQRSPGVWWAPILVRASATATWDASLRRVRLTK